MFVACQITQSDGGSVRAGVSISGSFSRPICKTFESVTPSVIENLAVMVMREDESRQGIKDVRAIDEHVGELHMRRKGCLALCHLPALTIEKVLTDDGEDEGKVGVRVAVYRK